VKVPAINKVFEEKDDTYLWSVDYLDRIIGHLFESEDNDTPDPKYMELQRQYGMDRCINVKMRSILLNWIVEVHHKFKLEPQTLYLTVNLLDRFLSTSCVINDNLQLCGSVCFWIACKYHELLVPVMDDFVHIADNAFDKEDMRIMEEDVATTLGFKLTVPTAYSFIQPFIKAAQHNIVTQEQRDTFKHFALYTMESAIFDYSCLKYKPSIIAAGAVFHALKKTGYAVWNDQLTKICRIDMKAQELQSIIREIRKVMKNRKLHAVKDKYSRMKTHEVARIMQSPDSTEKKRRLF